MCSGDSQLFTVLTLLERFGLWTGAGEYLQNQPHNTFSIIFYTIAFIFNLFKQNNSEVPKQCGSSMQHSHGLVLRKQVSFISDTKHSHLSGSGWLAHFDEMPSPDRKGQSSGPPMSAGGPGVLPWVREWPEKFHCFFFFFLSGSFSQIKSYVKVQCVKQIDVKLLMVPL